MHYEFTLDDVVEFKQLQDGECSFEVVDAKVTSTKPKEDGTVNDMIVVDVELKDSQGGCMTIKDYIVLTPKAKRKAKDIMVATGKLKSGTLSIQDLAGSGRCIVGLGEPNLYGKRYTKVLKYLPKSKDSGNIGDSSGWVSGNLNNIPRSGVVSAPPIANAVSFDDIPF